MKIIFYLHLIIPTLIFSQNGIDYNTTVEDTINNILIDKVSKSPITGEVYLLDDGVEIIAQPIIGAYSGMEINPVPYEKIK